MSALEELVLKNRSYRSFAPDINISRDTLLGFINNARISNAAMNMQTLKYRIVTDGSERAKILAISRFAASLGKKLPPEGHEPSAYIVICHDENICKFKPIFMNDVGIVAAVIMLSATEAGYGGCIIGSASAENIKATLGLDDNLIPQLILALGKPDEKVTLTEASDGNVKYYRDAENAHYVPKRRLEDIII